MTARFVGDRRPEHSGSAIVREQFRVTNVYAPRLGSGKLDESRVVLHAECMTYGAGIGVVRITLSRADAGHLRVGSIITLEFTLTDLRDDAPTVPLADTARAIMTGEAKGGAE